MNKIIIIFLILCNIYITLSLKAGFLDYDEVTDIDENNSEFNFEYNDWDSTFILVIIKTKSILNYNCKCGSSEIEEKTPAKSSFIIKATKGTCNIKITADFPFELEGTILIHDIKKEIDYPSKNKDIYAYDNILESDEKVPDIIYSLPTFQEDFKAKFTYSNVKISRNGKEYTLANPIRVC